MAVIELEEPDGWVDIDTLDKDERSVGDYTSEDGVILAEFSLQTFKGICLPSGCAGQPSERPGHPRPTNPSV